VCRENSMSLLVVAARKPGAFKKGRLGASCASRPFDIEGNNLTPRPM